MHLTRKLEKLTTGEAFASGVDRYYRFRYPLKVSDLLSGIDPARLEAICAKYRVPGEDKAWPKYTNVEHWLQRAVDHVRSLRLDRKPLLRILDIGSGAGYFLYVLKQIGHSGFGLDLAEPEFYGEMFDLLGLERVVFRIEPYQPLPEIGRQFDLITAFAICFNGHGTEKVWGQAEWGYFLDDVFARYLVRGGRIVLSLNPEPHGHYTPELRDCFIGRGARVEPRRIWLQKG
ncbi:MAG: hypothetical protein JO308_15175 [Verrucomicrobia bacterium]|nr:hypothetical protein [Verrucomicrobiota bacterium]